jgi:hypothetical protein
MGTAARPGGDSSGVPAAAQVTCNSGHVLQKGERSCYCDVCGSSAYSAWTCHTCNFDLCPNCHQQKSAALGGSPSSSSEQAGGHYSTTPGADHGAAPPSSTPGKLYCAEPSSSNYSSDSGEKWLGGNNRRPFGKFDTSNRKLNSKFRDVLNRWNEWVEDSNEPYEEFTTDRDDLYREDRDLDGCYRSLHNILEKMERYLPNMRQVIEDAIQLTKATHPAVHKMEEERKRIVAVIRVLREETEREYNELSFLASVKKPMDNIKLVLAELESSKDFANGTINIDGYYGEYYYFEGQCGGWRNCDIPRVGLGEVEKAKALLEGRPGHLLLAEVAELERTLRETHSYICLKYARHFASEGWMDKSQEYRSSYLQVHGETDDLRQLDQELAAAGDAVTKQREAEAEKARLEYEQREREAAEERAKLKQIWKDRFTQGATIYCDQEEWSYDPSGLVKLKGSETYYEWTGYSLSGSMYGTGYWDGSNFSWWYDNRTIYKYHFNGEKFTLQEGNGIPSCSWNGLTLVPENPGDGFRNRLVRFDGEAPPLVCLAIALRPWARDRISECSGERLCRSALFGEGQQGMTCENCSTNYRMNCAVCGDYVSFPRNIAHCCKYCVTFVGSNCMKCGGSFARVPAFVCDTCKFNFSAETHCTRNKP